MVSRSIILVLALVLLAAPAAHAVHDFQASPASGRIPVIVMLEESPLDTSGISTQAARIEAVRERGAMYAEAQEGVLAGLSDGDFDVRHRYTIVNGFAGEASPEGLEKLRSDPRVKEVFPDRQVHVQMQQSIPFMSADDAHKIQVGGTNITGAGETICVLDTGVDYTHKDLGNCTNTSFLAGTCPKVLAGYDFCGDTGACGSAGADTDPMDNHGHGTHCAGIAAASGNITGTAPAAKIVAIKVLNATGDGQFSDVKAGIDWCVNNASLYNITVISMSIGDNGQWNNPATDCDGWPTALAIDAARQAGIIVFAASGNSGYNDGINYPACATNATSVGSTSDGSEVISPFTNVDEILDILAPGSWINSTVPSGSCIHCSTTGYRQLQGTSMATPHAAGLAALMIQYEKLVNNRSIMPYEIEDMMKREGNPITHSGANLTFPRIDALDSINAALVLNSSESSLENSTYAKVMFLSGTNLTNASAAFMLGAGFVYLNDSYPQFNKSANITMYGLGFNVTPAVFRDGDICKSPECNITGYSGGAFNFTVLHFTNYTAGTNTNLTVWDSTDIQAMHINQSVSFYANYTNITGGVGIAGASCNVSFTDSMDNSMPYNATSMLYWYNRTFSSAGTYAWNVTCDEPSFEKMTAADNTEITNSVPGIYNTTISPSSAFNSTALNCSAVPADYENSTVNVSFTWHKDGSLNATWDANVSCTNATACNTSVPVPPSATAKGQAWVCSARSFDGANWSAWLNSTEVTVQNSAPSVPSLSAPANGSNISTQVVPFNYSSTDADNDTITYTIYINGVMNTTTTSNSTQIGFSDSIHYWSVQASDGSANSSMSGTRSFTVDTAAPSVSAGVSATLALSGENITIQANVSDLLLSSVWYNISNSTWSVANSMAANSSTSSEYNTSGLGNGFYNVTVFANDSLGHTGNASAGAFEATNASSNLTLGFRDSQASPLTIPATIYYNGTGSVRNQTNTSQLSWTLPSGYWDVELRADSFNITIFSMNVTQDVSENITIDTNISASGISPPGGVLAFLRTVAAEANTTSAALVIGYDDSGFVSESRAVAYACHSWNITSQLCAGSWTDVSANATFDSSGNTCTINTSGLSAFSIGESFTCGDGICDSSEDCSSCSSDCGLCPPPPGGGGPGGGLAVTASPPGEVNGTDNTTEDLAAPEVICAAGERRCSGSALQECSADGTSWDDLEVCGEGCNESSVACIVQEPGVTGSVVSGDDTAGWMPDMGMIIFVAAVIAASGAAASLFLRKSVKTKKAGRKRVSITFG
jgi:subtilisin family serine protease